MCGNVASGMAWSVQWGMVCTVSLNPLHTVFKWQVSTLRRNLRRWICAGWLLRVIGYAGLNYRPKYATSYLCQVTSALIAPLYRRLNNILEYAQRSRPQMKTSQLAVEAIVVGIGLVLITLIVVALYRKVAPALGLHVELPTVCAEYNKYHAMEVTLFISGALFHILCEWSGINEWYCRNRSQWYCQTLIYIIRLHLGTSRNVIFINLQHKGPINRNLVLDRAGRLH